MTVSAAFSRKVILGAGWANPLTHAFLAEDAAHVKVYADDEQLVFGVDYVVNDVGDLTGYEVEIVTPGDWNPTYWTLIVDTPVDQPSDVDQGGQFGLRYENALDALARRLQVLATRMTRVPLLPTWWEPTDPVPVIEVAPGEVMGWNDDGTRVVGKGVFDTTVLGAILDDAEQAATDAEQALADATALFGTTAAEIATIEGNLAFLNTLPAIADGVTANALQVSTDKATVAADKAFAALAADNATAAEAAVEQLKTDILAGFANFDERYLGAFALPPDERPDTTPLVEGDLYYDLAIELMQIWTGVAWTNAAGNPDALLASSNLSDLANLVTARANLDVLSTAAAQAYSDAAVKARLNATAKDPVVDADRIFFGDSTATFDLVYSTLTQFKAYLKSYFDTVYPTSALMTTRGDLIRRGAAAPERLPVGSAAEQSVYFDGTDAIFGWPVDNFVLNASDATTAITTGTNKSSMVMPYAGDFVDVWAGLRVAQASGSTFTVDVNKNGTTILSTKVTIDNTELNSLTAAVARVISVASFAKGDVVSVDVDQVGASGAMGLSVILQTRRTS